jgi:GNAT superfamily N-acetyltransferase
VSALTVRPARDDERDAVLGMYEWLFDPPGARPHGWEPGHASRALADTLDSDRSTVLVAESGDGLIGFCTAYLSIDSVRFGQRCWVEELAVDPDRRSEGVGAALLAEARRWASAHGATHLKLDSSLARKDAHRFYEREDPSYRSISYVWQLEE